MAAVDVDDRDSSTRDRSRRADEGAGKLTRRALIGSHTSLAVCAGRESERTRVELERW